MREKEGNNENKELFEYLNMLYDLKDENNLSRDQKFILDQYFDCSKFENLKKMRRDRYMTINVLKSRSKIISSFLGENELSNSELLKFLESINNIDLNLIARFFKNENISFEEYGLLINMFNYLEAEISIKETLDAAFLHGYISDIIKFCLDYKTDGEKAREKTREMNKEKSEEKKEEKEEENRWIEIPHRIILYYLAEKEKQRICFQNDCWVAIRGDGTLETWRDNAYNQRDKTPTGKFISVASGDRHSVGIREDGTVVTWGSDIFGNFMEKIPPNYSHSVSLRSDGTIIINR